MIYAILSDIHANLEALENVLADADTQGAERIICLGDVVGYGPLPRETLELIRKRATIVLAGNHDDAVSGRLDPENFIEIAKDAVSRHRKALTSKDLDYLGNLPYLGDLNEDIFFAHGDLTEPEVFNYIGSEEAARENFRISDAHILFVGHTHIPLVHIAEANGRVTTFQPHDFTAAKDRRYIVNVGTVGYPRQTTQQDVSTYVLFDSKTKKVRFRHLPFAVSSLLQRGDGEMPKPKKRKCVWMLIPLVASVLCTAGALTEWRLHHPATEAMMTEPEEKCPVIAAEEIYFTPAKSIVRANLQLAKKSCSVRLSIHFLDELQNIIKSESTYVNTVSRKAFAIPSGAIKARFELRAAQLQTEILVKRFSPSAE